MAVRAENLCFETNMGFGPYAICGTQDCFMGSALLIEDGFSFQQLNHLPSSSSSCSLPLEIAQSLSSDLEKQRMEMDWFLQLEVKTKSQFLIWSMNACIWVLYFC